MSIEKLVLEAEQQCVDEYKKIAENEYYFSSLVLDAFRSENINESHFNMTTGYGYSDSGRGAIERVFAKVLKGEKALVRNQFISGSHALSTCLFALLRPNDPLLSISGLPYDTLHEVIGIKDNPSSLKSYNINYEQIDLIDDKFDIPRIIKELKEKKIKVIEIQRSKGYSTRKSISINAIKEAIKEMKKIFILQCYMSI